MSRSPFDLANTGEKVLIESALGQVYAHVHGGGTANGTQISLWTFVDQPNLYWYIRPSETSGYYYLVSAVDPGRERVLHQHGANNDNGGNITLWEKVNPGNTQVRFQDAGNGYYNIIFRHSNKAVHVHGGGTANGTNITQWDPVNQNNLKWRFIGSDRDAVRYGNRIVLAHVATGRSLHSHNLNYSHHGTSSQQQVTAYGGARNNDDIWEVHPGKDIHISNGTPVRFGETIRLKHVATGRFLHSHGNHKSPVTHQQEVTGYGNNDSNDNWRIEEINGGQSGSAWNRNTIVRLLHSNTNHSLHSHNHDFEVQPGNRQGEVTGWPIGSKDGNDQWRVERVDN